MRRGARPFARISDNRYGADTERTTRSAGRIPGRVLRGGSSMKIPFPLLVFCCVLLGAALLSGCGSSRRFASHEGKNENAAPPAKKPGPRFAHQEREEETREDDHKPAPGEIEKITGGSRDFKHEKNPAIKPLDQSKMMREISRYMGVPYVYGGMSESGLDCSGYTSLVFERAIGVKLPRSAAEQSKTGHDVALSDLKFGDLIFFNTTGESASHVGIYLGDDLFAHASVSLGVTISSLESSYFKTRYESARRIVE